MTNLITYSSLVTNITELWWTWHKLYPKTKDFTMSWDKRAKIVTECEAINEKLNDLIEQIDDIFNDD